MVKILRNCYRCTSTALRRMFRKAGTHTPTPHSCESPRSSTRRTQLVHIWDMVDTFTGGRWSKGIVTKKRAHTLTL